MKYSCKWALSHFSANNSTTKQENNKDDDKFLHFLGGNFENGERNFFDEKAEIILDEIKIQPIQDVETSNFQLQKVAKFEVFIP